MDKIEYDNTDALLETTEEGALIKNCIDKINEIIDWINAQ
jgi:hypothetical protein|tara:strand:+ start:18021 stop:18140 length:120 start_codon:yes stop_codon:yes gene_type:complete